MASKNINTQTVEENNAEKQKENEKMSSKTNYEGKESELLASNLIQTRLRALICYKVILRD